MDFSLDYDSTKYVNHRRLRNSLKKLRVDSQYMFPYTTGDKVFLKHLSSTLDDLLKEFDRVFPQKRIKESYIGQP